VAFVVLQAGEIILPAFEAPAWILQLLVVLAALGFPLVLVVAWVYALTPRGLERTRDLDEEAGFDGVEPSVLPQVALVVATLIVLGGAGIWFVRQPPVDAAQLPGETAAAPGATAVSDADMRITSIAVLPLDDYASDPGEDYFAASMHEEIVAQLSRVSSLRVVSRTSVMQYAGSEKLAPEIGAELGVQGIVEGSVTRADGRVRISVQLIHAPSDTHIWANSYEREMENVLTLQAEVANEVAEAIQGEVEAVETPQRIVAEPIDARAMDVYMQAHFEQEQGTPEALASAVTHIEEALAIDSTFAPALVGLAGTHFLIGLQESDSTASDDLLEAVRAAETALLLDNQSEEARAVILAATERLQDLGEQFEMSYEMDASVDSLSRDYLRTSTDFGRTTRDVMVLRAESPKSLPTVWRIGAAQQLLADGRTENAVQILEEILEENPNAIPAWDALERAYAAADDFDEVIETRRKRILALSEDSERAMADAEAIAEAIEERGARGYWEWLRDDHQARQQRGEYSSQVEFAAACVALGEYEDAIGSLEQSLAERDRGLVSLQSDPVWDPLRQDPRFQRIQAAVRRSLRPARPEESPRPREPGRR